LTLYFAPLLAGGAAAAALRRVEMADMYAPQDLQEKPDVNKVRT
jgi:hypothetical protein